MSLTMPMPIPMEPIDTTNTAMAMQTIWLNVNLTRSGSVVLVGGGVGSEVVSRQVVVIKW